MTHMYLANQALCTLEQQPESLDATDRWVNCPDCLHRAIVEAEERTRILRELLAQACKRCRVYDALCINPRYCDAHDACCAGDPACRAEVP